MAVAALALWEALRTPRGGRALHAGHGARSKGRRPLFGCALPALHLVFYSGPPSFICSASA